jgi:NAD(P)-dependent dehydrogenase (short-subunit alcohol dehydrogenase family)
MSGVCAGKIALVTGAASGIGRASAVALARAGASVMAVDVAACDDTVAAITSAGGTARSLAVDVADEQAVARMVAATVEAFGGLHVAFNNAGVAGVFTKTHDYPSDDWARVMAVNLTGVWHCMKYELRHMLKHGGGSIINTASVAGLVGMSHAAAYSAAKAGVIGLTKNAAIEYARDNIRINAVCPGGVRTQMTESADRSLPGFLDRIAKLEPMGRVAEPEEIASAVVWLASDGASFMTGHALPVDGGFVAR